MTEHKHATLLRAIADGENIEVWKSGYGWGDAVYSYLFAHIADGEGIDWRIKPEKKPDFTEFLTAGVNDEGKFYVVFHDKDYYSGIPNLKLTFDGETERLIKAEIIE